MKILFVFSFPIRIGGSFKSALAMVKQLCHRGHKIVIAAPGGSEEMEKSFREAGAEINFIEILGKRLPIPTLSGARELEQIVRREKIELIHAQDYPSIGRAYLAAIRSNCAFLVTEAGGFFPYHVPPRYVDTILFSKEQESVFIQKYPLITSNLHLIRARIDTDVYRPSLQSPTFVKRHALPMSGTKICMAIRLEKQKKRWINAMFLAASQLKKDNCQIHFVVAGEGSLLDEFKQQALQFNQSCPEGGLSIRFIGPVLGVSDICDFYNYADVVIGNGRGILEAMACKKSVMVLGESGQGQWLGPDNVKQVAHYNFSGRHFRYDSIPQEGLGVLLKSVVTNPEKQIQYAEFAYDYIHQCMDAKLGAEKLSDVYQKAMRKKIMFKHFVAWYLKAIFHKIMGIGHILRK